MPDVAIYFYTFNILILNIVFILILNMFSILIHVIFLCNNVVTLNSEAKI